MMLKLIFHQHVPRRPTVEAHVLLQFIIDPFVFALFSVWSTLAKKNEAKFLWPIGRKLNSKLSVLFNLNDTETSYLL